MYRVGGEHVNEMLTSTTESGLANGIAIVANRGRNVNTLRYLN